MIYKYLGIAFGLISLILIKIIIIDLIFFHHGLYFYLVLPVLISLSAYEILVDKYLKKC
jgi:hypothetical protein